jgi:hypothetical protein
MFDNQIWRRATLAFAAGTLGALVLCLFVWALIALHITAAVGLSLPPDINDMTKVWLYKQMVWGGIWGFIFLLPWRPGWWLRGLVYGLGPSLVTLFVLLPPPARENIALVVLVLVANSVWGLVASWWLTRVDRVEAHA